MTIVVIANKKIYENPFIYFFMMNGTYSMGTKYLFIVSLYIFFFFLYFQKKNNILIRY
jgi:hypothetical protein